MAAYIEDHDRVHPLAVIDRFRATVARCCPDDPVHVADGIATTFAELANRVDARHRAAERAALAALAHGETIDAVSILRAAAEGEA